MVVRHSDEFIISWDFNHSCSFCRSNLYRWYDGHIQDILTLDRGPNKRDPRSLFDRWRPSPWLWYPSLNCKIRFFFFYHRFLKDLQGLLIPPSVRSSCRPTLPSFPPSHRTHVFIPSSFHCFHRQQLFFMGAERSCFIYKPVKMALISPRMDRAKTVSGSTYCSGRNPPVRLWVGSSSDVLHPSALSRSLLLH